jgi:hypothetical protein
MKVRPAEVAAPAAALVRRRELSNSRSDADAGVGLQARRVDCPVKRRAVLVTSTLANTFIGELQHEVVPGDLTFGRRRPPTADRPIRYRRRAFRDGDVGNRAVVAWRRAELGPSTNPVGANVVDVVDEVASCHS